MRLNLYRFCFDTGHERRVTGDDFIQGWNSSMGPSDRHVELQNMLRKWIENRSFKRCGLPEANVVGYIADFVAIAGMYNSHHTRYTRHSGLKKKYMSSQLIDGRWVRKVLGDVDRWYVCVFEVKVSRNDFLNTFGGKHTPHAKARMEPVGTAHWVVAEKGICEPDELPDFWGLLVPYGAGLTEKKMPKLHPLPEENLHAIAFDMLWLQMNYRRSYYDQMADMAGAIKSIHHAVLAGKSQAELLELSSRARKACKGL